MPASIPTSNCYIYGAACGFIAHNRNRCSGVYLYLYLYLYVYLYVYSYLYVYLYSYLYLSVDTGGFILLNPATFTAKCTTMSVHVDGHLNHSYIDSVHFLTSHLTTVQSCEMGQTYVVQAFKQGSSAVFSLKYIPSWHFWILGYCCW